MAEVAKGILSDQRSINRFVKASTIQKNEILERSKAITQTF